MNRIALIGRTRALLDTGKLLLESGKYNIPLIITAPEAPEYKVKSEDFKQFAESIGAVYFCTNKINSSEVIQRLESMPQIDIALSVNYTNIITQKIISYFKHGILNSHAGDLPKYRGNAVMAWAILNKEEKIGLSIHKMIGGELDSGAIICKEFMPLSLTTRVGELYDWFYQQTPKMFLQAINALAGNPSFIFEEQSKNKANILRCYPRIPEDGKINWSESNDAILRLINASSEPFIGAFCNYKNERISIFRAEILEDGENYLAMPGQVSSINKADGSVDIITGKGKLKLLDIEVHGERIAPANLIKSIRKRLT